MDPSLEVTQNLNILVLVLHASIPVKLVMGLLIAASIASWTIIFGKSRMLDVSNKEANEFEERFWSGTDMAALFRDIGNKQGERTGLESIFEAGFREFARLRSRR